MSATTAVLDALVYFATGLGHQSVVVFFVLSGYFVGGGGRRGMAARALVVEVVRGERLPPAHGAAPRPAPHAAPRHRGGGPRRRLRRHVPRAARERTRTGRPGPPRRRGILRQPRVPADHRGAGLRQQRPPVEPARTSSGTTCDLSPRLGRGRRPGRSAQPGMHAPSRWRCSASCPPTSCGPAASGSWATRRRAWRVRNASLPLSRAAGGSRQAGSA